MTPSHTVGSCQCISAGSLMGSFEVRPLSYCGMLHSHPRKAYTACSCRDTQALSYTLNGPSKTLHAQLCICDHCMFLQLVPRPLQVHCDATEPSSDCTRVLKALIPYVVTGTPSHASHMPVQEVLSSMHFCPQQQKVSIRTPKQLLLATVQHVARSHLQALEDVWQGRLQVGAVA